MKFDYQSRADIICACIEKGIDYNRWLDGGEFDETCKT